jgi:molybdenum cofactor guanylyltransferase
MKSCIILCGGLSRRMGQDKGSMLFNNKPMILHLLKTVKNVADEILLVLRDEKQVDNYREILDDLEADLKTESDLKIVTDIFKDQGPLIGILTGLSNISSDKALILPCDSPNVSESFIYKMFKLAEDQRFAAVVPRWSDGRVEPLHSVYRKENIKIIEKLIEKRIRDVKSLLTNLEVRYIDAEALDKTGATFQNVNRPENVI